MPIDPNRISRDIETIAGFNASTPDIGYSRPTFSLAWRKARDYVISQAEEAGCNVRIDAAGNIHVRHASIRWDEKIWLSGSHIDSVPSGGKYDGVVGVVVPLEIIRASHAAGDVLPLELVVFAEEEGTTFGIAMIGSRLWANLDGPFAGNGDDGYFHQFRNRDGQTYFDAGALRRTPKRSPRRPSRPRRLSRPDRDPCRTRPGHVARRRAVGRGHGNRRPQTVQGQVHGIAESRGLHADAFPQPSLSVAAVRVTCGVDALAQTWPGCRRDGRPNRLPTQRRERHPRRRPLHGGCPKPKCRHAGGFPSRARGVGHRVR